MKMDFFIFVRYYFRFAEGNAIKKNRRRCLLLRECFLVAYIEMFGPKLRLLLLYNHNLKNNNFISTHE